MNIYEKALAHYGLESQMGIATEEMGELLQAINKYRRNPSEQAAAQVAEEIADVEIILEQLKLYFNTQHKQRKLQRLAERLGGEYEQRRYLYRNRRS